MSKYGSWVKSSKNTTITSWRGNRWKESRGGKVLGRKRLTGLIKPEGRGRGPTILSDLECRFRITRLEGE